ncbi:hypothetical protein BKA62DRAFT_510565 [Auriculariales sp. MPI-PUGE-AT-0066]|nr:hypothetical protein BKA62DRAFT_510565 [Auriculariales sp. MPI-PUGE-AT-0066]
MSGPNNLEPSRSPVDNATITMDAHETLVRQSPSAVRRVPFQHLGFETFRPGFTALQFNISGPSDALQPRLGSRHQSHGENQRQQQQGQPDTVPLPAELPHLRDDSSSDSDSEDEAPYMQLTLRPPTPRPAPAIDSDNDLPSLFTVSDSSDNAQDQSDDDDEDWTDEDEDDSTVPEPSDPRSAPFLFGGDNVPSGDPMDVWQALIGSMPTERPPDPERAKELIHGLEAIPDDLLDRWFAAAGENADVMCAICRDDLADPSATRSSEKDAVSRLLALSCRHVFHSECLAPWLARRTTCPTCRFDIDPDSLTLRQPPQPAMSSSDQITQLLAPFMPQRRQVDGSAAPGTAAVDPAQFDYAERLRQLISESEDTPPTSPLDTNAWQHSLRTFIMLGYEIENAGYTRTWRISCDVGWTKFFAWWTTGRHSTPPSS